MAYYIAPFLLEKGSSVMCPLINCEVTECYTVYIHNEMFEGDTLTVFADFH